MVWAAPYLPVPAVVATGGVGTAPPSWSPRRCRGPTPPSRRGARDLPALVRALGQGCARSTTPSARNGAPSASTWPRLGPRRGAGPQRRHPHQPASTPSTRHLTPAAALAELEATAPDDEDLVVCHGDYCPPNVLLEGGRVTGYVDLGELGVADRWWDVAVGAWSVGWNFGEELEPLFYESYGVDPGPGPHPLLPPALRPRVLTGAVDRAGRARANTASNIGTVSLPVNVFCWLGW